MKTLLSLILTALTSSAIAQGNVMIVNPPNKPVPVKGSFAATVTFPTATPIFSSAKENSHVLKASAGTLVSLSVTSDVDQYILIMNSTTVPADGAVTLLYPPIHVAANSTTMVYFGIPLVAGTGISVCNSNANSFTKTIGSANCIFTGQVQ